MIAVDAVLLPPRKVMLQAVELNGQAVEKGFRDIILDPERCIPHITLAMGCIERELIPRAEEALASVASRFAPIEINGISGVRNGTFIMIERTKAIQAVHEAAVSSLAGYLEHAPDEGMLCRDGHARTDPMTLEYISRFGRDSSFDNYWPHITISTAVIETIPRKYVFTCDMLALCHLGDLCTCRKILFSHRLAGKEH